MQVFLSSEGRVKQSRPACWLPPQDASVRVAVSARPALATAWSSSKATTGPLGVCDDDIEKASVPSWGQQARFEGRADPGCPLVGCPWPFDDEESVDVGMSGGVDDRCGVIQREAIA
jgi:hypothetical protein